MRFHLAQLSMTLSGLERSNGGQKISEGRNVLLMMDRKSYMVFNLVTFALS